MKNLTSTDPIEHRFTAGYRPVCKNNQASDADSFVFSRKIKSTLFYGGGANNALVQRYMYCWRVFLETQEGLLHKIVQ